MFLDFFYKLRARGVPVTTHTWLAFVVGAAGSAAVLVALMR